MFSTTCPISKPCIRNLVEAKHRVPTCLAPPREVSVSRMTELYQAIAYEDIVLQPIPAEWSPAWGRARLRRLY